MRRIGHNDPCPCGSGKKYKKCCLEKDRHPAGGGEANATAFASAAGASAPPAADKCVGLGYTSGERASALEKLMGFMARPEFRGGLEIAASIFWGSLIDERSDEDIRRILSMEQSEANFNAWVLFDMDVEDGKTIADFFLASEGDRLSRGERNFVITAMGTHFRLYEVEEVVLDEGFRLRDLWTGESFRVKEKAATHFFFQWDLMATRLLELGDGLWEIQASCFNYPPEEKQYFLDDLKAKHRLFRRNLPGQDETAFFKRHGFLFNHWWLERVAFPSFPEIVTAEGDQLLFTRAVFDCTDPVGAVASLNESPETERIEENLYEWFEEAADYRRPLGTIRLQKNRLILETTSRERGERGRLMLERTAGGSIRYRLSDHQSVGQALKSSRKAPRSGVSGLDPEVEAKVRKEFYDRHYRKWLDEKLPALSNKTPRHAVTLKTYRPKVIDLLKQFENTAARAASRGEAPYDFGWLWKELALERET